MCIRDRMNTGAKYDTKAFQKSVGLNGVGTKAVNALSHYFKVQSTREGKAKIAEFEKGLIKKDFPVQKSDEKDGTTTTFIPDPAIFKNYHFIPEYLDNLLWNYVYL